MPRPCETLHPVVSPDTCKICKRYTTDEKFRAYCDSRPARVVPATHANTPNRATLCEYIDEKEVLDKRGKSCPGCWVLRCDKFEKCTRTEQVEGIPHCGTCAAYLPRGQVYEPPTAIQLTLHGLAPGDAVVMSAAIESLHKTYPGKYLTAVDTVAQEIWEHHPYVWQIKPWEQPLFSVRTIPMAYPLINQSDAIGCHFMEAYCRYLGEQLGVPLPLAVNKPALYLSDQERTWTTQIAETIGKHIPYWVINAGHKLDFTAKWWGTRNFQEVVDGLRGKVTFVQIGELGPNHNHPPLQGVIDLRGKTTTRQLLRLVYHAVGGVGPSTLLQHVCAAFDKPYVLIAGGREPRAWQQYPLQTTLSAVGTLNCCATRACWKSRTIKLNDGDEKDQSLCDRPMLQPDGGFIPMCLEQITPPTVIQAISGYRRVALY